MASPDVQALQTQVASLQAQITDMLARLTSLGQLLHDQGWGHKQTGRARDPWGDLHVAITAWQEGEST